MLPMPRTREAEASNEGINHEEQSFWTRHDRRFNMRQVVALCLLCGWLGYFIHGAVLGYREATTTPTFKPV